MKIRNLLITFFSALSTICFGQAGKSFSVHGQITNPKLDSVSMLYINDQGKIIRQIIPAENGKFDIAGTINQPTMAYLLFMHKGEKLNKREAEIKTNKVYIEPGEMTINAEEDRQGYVTVKGSKSQIEWNDLKSKTRPIQSALDSLSNGDARKAPALLREQLAKINYAYFIGHPGSYVAANQVTYFMSSYSLDSLKRLYDNYLPEIKESIDGKRLAATIKGRTAGLPGTMAFQFTVKDKDGKDLALADFKGKYVLLDFWATWCVPCRKSMPHMIGLYQKYKAKNFDVIGIGDDDNRVKEWMDAIEHDGIGMFHHTLRGVNMEMFRKGIPNPRDLDEGYGIRALPTLILIDPAGKIIGRFSGNEEELDTMLASVIK
ncbi:TlpA disulfide reductase family protein [Mucilaginibacter jinjuensis]|uniref:TlpA disulfide reductase family protein n=1 Tax=Mucilaginibacter jinjuensis TaxID=1176721 RepID=A0ABY7TA76_9SPHI|nr:TlpA disulfide reductase family protein [Mucilaginibacter jinjuensis]WCT13410.1 TlpA disulfide reductase family protein [Mucilaginibacter jinjuensis]